MNSREPITVSMAYGINPEAISVAGAIDVTLNCDTNLFIDPMLIGEAGNSEFRDCAIEAYQKRFELLIKLLIASEERGDIAWAAARKQLNFHEVRFTHLGYSGGSKGSGFGSDLSERLIATAKQVVKLGVRDPDLFAALALIEPGVGADRISDMTTNIIAPCLANFSLSVAERLGMPMREYAVSGARYSLPINPIAENEPIIFVPKDIVRDLPIATDWKSVAAAAQYNQDLRDRVNNHLGEMWRAHTRREKEGSRDRALKSKDAFELLLEAIRAASAEPYDIKNDRNGEIYPAHIRMTVAKNAPLDLSQFAKQPNGKIQAIAVVELIIEKFKELVEENGLWKELWDDKHLISRNEKAVQRLFFAVASAYCEANRLDISPESNAGNGPVDFKVSGGGGSKVLVEIKLSTNTSLVTGYTKQLEAYRSSERTSFAYYVVVDVGRLTSKKVSQLSLAKSQHEKSEKGASKIVYIDGNPQKSASKR